LSRVSATIPTPPRRPRGASSLWINEETHLFFERFAERRRQFRERYAYYHQDNLDYFQRVIQTDSRVLLIGCDVTWLANHLRCQELFLLELDPSRLQDSLPTYVKKVSNLQDTLNTARIDYVILPYTLQYLEDIQTFLETLNRGLPGTARIVILQYNFLWSPLLKFAEKIGLKTPNPDLNWLGQRDVQNLLTLTNFQEVTYGVRCLLPFFIPGLTMWVNRYLASLWPFEWFCQKDYAIARPLKRTARALQVFKTSVIVPARNEAGNIARLLSELPALGDSCEIIFVEGHSRDNTWEEIQRQIACHARRSEFSLKTYQQKGEGKADAVRVGCSQASGDILMILDSDLSVRPADLAHFYDAIVSGAAEFVNGSRLVYRMEKEAMQILNLFFNKVFGVFVSWLIGQQVKDTLCGSKALFRHDYERVRRHFSDLGSRDPFGDFELLFGASCLNLKICDVPVGYKQRTYGQTNIRRFRHGWQLLRMCLACWRNLK
jgi:hypothetical protein